MKDKMPGLTPRLLLIVLILVPINCYFLIQMELVRYTFPTWIVPLSNVIFILMVVIVINYLIRWITPRNALRQGELLLLYVMLSVTTTLSAGDILQATLSVLGHPFWFATLENEEKAISIDEVNYGEYTGEMYHADIKPDLSIFSNSEIKTMIEVKEYFKDFGSREIKEFSHKERGYKETYNGQIISYAYAEDLQI